MGRVFRLGSSVLWSPFPREDEPLGGGHLARVLERFGLDTVELVVPGDGLWEELPRSLREFLEGEARRLRFPLPYASHLLSLGVDGHALWLARDMSLGPDLVLCLDPEDCRRSFLVGEGVVVQFLEVMGAPDPLARAREELSFRSRVFRALRALPPTERARVFDELGRGRALRELWAELEGRAETWVFLLR